MTRKEKQTELERHRTLLLATLDYHIEHYTGGLVFDQWDPAAEHYLQQKQQTEKYFQQRRLDRLQQKLDRLTEHLSIQVDLHFASHIREKTGYDIDIYEDLRCYVASIVAQGAIDNKEEALNISEILRIYQQMPAEKEKVAILNSLLIDFFKRTDPVKQIGKFGYPTINQPMTGGIFEPNSPDGKRKVIVQSSGTGKNASTYVVIHLKGGSGSIYCATGMNLPIKAYWKNNSTVVIETKKNYLSSTRHNQVKSFQDVIKIEYNED